jgi:hypothetical protein
VASGKRYTKQFYSLFEKRYKKTLLLVHANN